MRKIPTSTFLLITFFAQEKQFDKRHQWISHKILHKKHYIVNFSTFFRLANISTGLLNNLKIKTIENLLEISNVLFFNWKFRPYGSCDLMGWSNYWSIFERKHPTNGKSKLYIYLDCFERVFNKLSNDTRLIDFALAVLSLLIIKGAL